MLAVSPFPLLFPYEHIIAQFLTYVNNFLQKKWKNFLLALQKNPLTEAHFYGDRYAIINNTDKEQTTAFYDMDGTAQEITLKAYEIKWVQ